MSSLYGLLEHVSRWSSERRSGGIYIYIYIYIYVCVCCVAQHLSRHLFFDIFEARTYFSLGICHLYLLSAFIYHGSCLLDVHRCSSVSLVFASCDPAMAQALRDGARRKASDNQCSAAGYQQWVRQYCDKRCTRAMPKLMKSFGFTRWNGSITPEQLETVCKFLLYTICVVSACKTKCN